ncbi:hypothetical protein [Parapedobacter sp. 2B3]|uniref:hypothetical protein n=1 Tax=Parapedobacter sp. 2B3 TaxID=3342381 RepID=UPI0035B64D9E
MSRRWDSNLRLNALYYKLLQYGKKKSATNDTAALKLITKIIAIVVRNNMEDFHAGGNLSDRQMAKLNPLIREGIFNAPFAIIHGDKDDYLKQYIGYHLQSIPNYWEDPELIAKLQAVCDKLQTANSAKREIRFKSEFLMEQYELGNIYPAYNGSIQLLGAFDFKGVDYDHRKKHKDKITYQLRKEGYFYSIYHDGYLNTK